MNPARLGLLAAALASPLLAAPAAERFREANDLARSGDYPKAAAVYAELAASGQESASLYWNWAQAATARGASGEALWALLRARELDPGDRAVGRDVERLREALNLDPAEIAPEPLAAAGRAARRFHLDLVALALPGPFSGSARARASGGGGRWAATTGRAALALGFLAAAVPVAASFARPTAAVVRRGAPLLDAASPTAEATGSLREGEVVPVLEAERRLGARRGQRRRAWLGARRRRAAARRSARPVPRLTSVRSRAPRAQPSPQQPVHLLDSIRLAASGPTHRKLCDPPCN